MSSDADCFVKEVLETFRWHDKANVDLHMPFGEATRSEDSYYVVYPERKANNRNVVLFGDWLIRQSRKHADQEANLPGI